MGSFLMQHKSMRFGTCLLSSVYVKAYLFRLQCAAFYCSLYWYGEYQQKMLYKEKILMKNKCNYLFLFSPEMKNGYYKEILQNKINEILKEVA